MIEHVVLTRKETLKLANRVDVATSKVPESPSCFSTCMRRRMTGKQTPEWLPLSLEVFEP